MMAEDPHEAMHKGILEALTEHARRINRIEGRLAHVDLADFERAVIESGPSLIYEPTLSPEDVERLKEAVRMLYDHIDRQVRLKSFHMGEMVEAKEQAAIARQILGMGE